MFFGPLTTEAIFWCTLDPPARDHPKFRAFFFLSRPSFCVCVCFFFFSKFLKSFVELRWHLRVLIYEKVFTTRIRFGETASTFSRTTPFSGPPPPGPLPPGPPPRTGLHPRLPAGTAPACHHRRTQAASTVTTPTRTTSINELVSGKKIGQKRNWPKEELTKRGIG